MTFNVLDPKIDVTGHCILEASAGTGKTFAIEHIAARLILEKRIPLSQILLVTFTRASTREMKQRLRSNLENIFTNLQKGINDPPYLTGCDANQMKRLVLSAIREFEEAQIFTIHGFCYQKLMENAFDCGEILQMKGPDEKTSEKKKMCFIRDFLHTLDDRYHVFDIKAVFDRYKKFQKLYSLLVQEIEKEEQEALRFDDLFKEATEKLQSFSVNVTDLESIFSFFKKRKVPVTSKHVECLKTLLLSPTKEHFVAFFETGMDLFRFLDPKNLKKKYVNQNISYPDGFLDLKESLESLYEKMLDPKRVLRLLANDLRKPYFAYMKEEGRSPDEILRKMYVAIREKPFFRKKISTSYQAVIIDEFQDTDPLQWEIFRELFLSIPTFYLVGDPKQSIYRFRKADIYTYIRASKSMKKILYLDTNYRSGASLISSLNTFFSKRKGWLSLPKKQTALDYRPVKAFHEDLDDHSLHFFLVEEKSRGNRWPTNRLEKDFFFPFIAKEIQKIGGKKSQFAVLVKDRFQAQSLREYFNHIGIGGICRTQTAVKDSPLFSSLRDIFTAIVFMDDSSKLKLALLTPFFGFSLHEIMKFEGGIPDRILEKFFQLRNVLMKEGLSSFFRAFLSMRCKELSVFESLIVQRLYSDFRELMEGLMEFVGCRRFSIDQMESFFETMEIEQEEARPVFDDDSVQILTIHSSKGLEFEHVFALGVISRSPEQDEDVQEVDAEKYRQLYVALTRAKKRLYVPLLIDLSEKEPEPGRASPMELFFTHLLGETPTREKSLKLLQDLGISVTYLEESIQRKKQESFLKEQLTRPPKVGLKTSNVTTTSFSALVKSRSFSQELERNKEQLPPGPATGIFLHSLLEKVLQEPISRDRMELVVRREVFASFYKPYFDEIQEMIQLAICESIYEGITPLEKVLFDRIQVELEFCYSLKRGLWMKGFMDLVFEDQGRYYIVDWKTNDLPSYDEESLQHVVQRESYALQASIYTQALRRFLKMTSNVSFEDVFGGVFFVFLRGLKSGKGVCSVKSDFSELKGIEIR